MSASSEPKKFLSWNYKFFLRWLCLWTYPQGCSCCFRFDVCCCDQLFGFVWTWLRIIYNSLFPPLFFVFSKRVRTTSQQNSFLSWYLVFLLETNCLSACLCFCFISLFPPYLHFKTQFHTIIVHVIVINHDSVVCRHSLNFRVSIVVEIQLSFLSVLDYWYLGYCTFQANEALFFILLVSTSFFILTIPNCFLDQNTFFNICEKVIWFIFLIYLLVSTTENYFCAAISRMSARLSVSNNLVVSFDGFHIQNQSKRYHNVFLFFFLNIKDCNVFGIWK